MKTASSLGTLVVLWYGGVGVIHGRLSLGDLVAFIAYLNLLAWPTMAAKGSLFLGRMTQMSDGLSVLLEANGR